jgi:hypothetical protein
MRSLFVFTLLLAIKAASRLFYRIEMRWVNDVPPEPWSDIRLVAFLHHTSLFEPIFAGGCPNRFLWRIARHGVIPAADKTMKRPLVGILFRLIARHVVPITRERDHTWFSVLNKIDPKSMVIILPEGRMMRKNGLDGSGQPMTMRGGVADVIDAVGQGRMLLAYSGGLHHVQAPGEHSPKIFRRVRMNLEVVRIEEYEAAIRAKVGDERFKKGVIEDLERRRDAFCPCDEESGLVNGRREPASSDDHEPVAASAD